MTQYTKSTLETLLATPAYVDEAIRLIGTNQTADELQTKGTHYQNGEGFSAAYARTGTRLYEFVTGIQTSTGKKKWAPKRASATPWPTESSAATSATTASITPLSLAARLPLSTGVSWKVSPPPQWLSFPPRVLSPSVLLPRP